MLTREHQLAHELEAVLIDAEKGKFDLTCMNTIRYVAKSLRALSEPAPLEGETPRTAKECIAAVVQELNLDTTDPFTKLLAVACGMQDAHQETKDALLRCQEEVHRLRDECSGLAAGACNVKNGLLAGEGGHAYCRLERELAQMSAQKAEAERRVSELEAKLAEARRDAERYREISRIHRMEFQYKCAVEDALIERLSAIHNLMHPEPIETKGKVFLFHPPDTHVREAWEGLSKAIREIPAAIDAAIAAERKEGKDHG